MAKPVCWITNAFDRSPSELFWVTRTAGDRSKVRYLTSRTVMARSTWCLTKRSAAKCKAACVSYRFHSFPRVSCVGDFIRPTANSIAAACSPGRATRPNPVASTACVTPAKPPYLPIELNATKTGIKITFSGKLDPKTASDPKSYAIQTWSLKRSAGYGSKHYDEKAAKVTAQSFPPTEKPLRWRLPTSNRHGAWKSVIHY